ncbi:MAG: hypothetical protein A2Z83_01500 [Omnitrophica bacterium GWA2_52_8]|nr:MAG: hypothetical protein A2Z83_01500 [Omnitrophica bacterium GWA2_52_8]
MAWRIGEILIRKRYIDWEQLEEVLAEQQTRKEFTGELLVQKGYISRRLLYKAIAEQNGLRFVDLKRTHINPSAVQMIPESLARKYNLLGVEKLPNMLIVAISSAPNLWPKAEIQSMTGIPQIKSVLCLPQDIQEAIQEWYAGDKITARAAS